MNPRWKTAGRLLLALAVVALALPAASVVAKSPWDVEVTPPDPATYARDPLWIKSQAAARARQSGRQQELRTPEARQRRRRSETAYMNVTPSAARELAQQTFPDLLTASADGLGLPDGVKLDKFLSPDTARLTDSAGKHTLLLGDGPIAAPDDHGRLAPIDLSLSTEQGKLVPDNPGVRVALPDSAGEALRLPGEDLDIVADGAEDVAGRVLDDRVFYPEVATDTDYVAVARPDGAQVMWQLRSPQATEAPSLDLRLPAGAQARLTSTLTGAPSGANPSVEIVKDGRVLSTISAPLAKDADGTAVPARYRLDGDKLVVDVPHRHGDVRYPILVDPEVHEVWGQADWDNFGKGPCNCTMAGLWSLSTNGSLFYPSTNPPTGAGRGLFIGSNPGFYWQGQSAQFTWGVPPYVVIYNAWFDGLYHVTQGDHVYYGIYGGGAWTWVNNDINYDLWYGGNTAYPSRYDSAAVAVLGVWEDQSVQHPITGWAGVRGVNVRVGEDQHPGVRLARLDTSAGVNAIDQNKWLSSGETLSASVVGGDVGLGLQHVGIMTMDNNWIGSSAWHSGCNGTRGAPCPLDVTWNGSLSLAGMNGYVQMRTTAVDVVDNPGFGPAWTLKVDGDTPFVGFGGDAWDHRADGTLGYNPTINVFATDGDAVHPNSGVKTAALMLDGQTVWQTTNSAGQCENCSINQPVTLPIASPGVHTVQGLVVDYVGRVNTTAAVTINVGDVQNTLPTSWNYGGSDHIVNTAAERSSVLAALQDADDDTTYNSLWNGLSSADRSGMTTYMQTAPTSDPSSPVDGAGLMDSSTSASAAQVGDLPVPTPATATNLGLCNTEPVSRGPIPPGAASGRATKAWAHIVDQQVLPDGQKGYKIRGEIEVYPNYRLLTGLNSWIWVRTDSSFENRSIKDKTNANQRDSTRAKPMPWYVHKALWVRAGRPFYWAGIVIWSPPLFWTFNQVGYEWHGDKLPGVGGLVWFRCDTTA